MRSSRAERSPRCSRWGPAAPALAAQRGAPRREASRSTGRCWGRCKAPRRQFRHATRARDRRFAAWSRRRTAPSGRMPTPCSTTWTPSGYGAGRGRALRDLRGWAGASRARTPQSRPQRRRRRRPGARRAGDRAATGRRRRPRGPAARRWLGAVADAAQDDRHRGRGRIYPGSAQDYRQHGNRGYFARRRAMDPHVGRLAQPQPDGRYRSTIRRAGTSACRRSTSRSAWRSPTAST